MTRNDKSILEFGECVDRPYSFRVIAQMGKRKPVLTAGPTRNIHWRALAITIWNCSAESPKPLSPAKHISSELQSAMR